MENRVTDGHTHHVRHPVPDGGRTAGDEGLVPLVEGTVDEAGQEKHPMRRAKGSGLAAPGQSAPQDCVEKRMDQLVVDPRQRLQGLGDSLEFAQDEEHGDPEDGGSPCHEMSYQGSETP